MPISNLTKFFEAQGKTIRYLRASNLGHYWHCSVQAFLQAQGVESPPNTALNIGKAIHDSITEARQLSQWEREFQEFITQFMVDRESGNGSSGLGMQRNKVFMRTWYDGQTAIGHITTHGVDDFKVYPDRQVILVEYKTTGQKYIDHYKLAPAIFQLKVYAWILEPYMKIGGYKLKHCEVIFLNRRGDPMGIKQVIDYDPIKVEADIANILDQFRNPEKLVPPARWKCLKCSEVYKSRCPFQKRESNAKKQA